MTILGDIQVMAKNRWFSERIFKTSVVTTRAWLRMKSRGFFELRGLLIRLE